MDEASALNILVVDDNPGDVELVKTAFEVCGMDAHFQTTGDAEYAVQVLETLLKHPDTPPPDLIILDLNMPRVGGMEVMKFINRHPALRAIPVLVVTGTDRAHDRQVCFDLGAVEYLVKPTFFEDEFALIERLKPLLDKDG